MNALPHPNPAASRMARENAELTQLRMRQLSAMLGDFAKQMNIVAPRVGHAFEIPGAVRFTDLELRDLFVDERVKGMTSLHGTVASVHDSSLEYVLFSYRYVGPHRYTVVRDTPQEIERLESTLQAHRIAFDLQLHRNARAQVERATFTIQSSIGGGVKFMADDEAASIRIGMRNVERLGDTTATLAAADFSQPLLDELGRCIIGMPNEFRRLVHGAGSPVQTWPVTRDGPLTFGGGD